MVFNCKKITEEYYFRRILLDTGDVDVPQYINHLVSVLKHEDITLAHIFISHWHHDHLGGLSDVLDIREKTSMFL